MDKTHEEMDCPKCGAPPTAVYDRDKGGWILTCYVHPMRYEAWGATYWDAEVAWTQYVARANAAKQAREAKGG